MMWRKSAETPLVFQAEAADCGLACLAMVAARHGYVAELAALRARHPTSPMGSTLVDMMRLASELKLSPRPVKVELENLKALKLPCVLHWDFNHFVVLTRVDGDYIVVHDPAVGRRRLSLQEASDHFTGVALELTPRHDFTPQIERGPMRLALLLKTVGNYRAAIWQVLSLALLLQVFVSVSPFYLQFVVDEVVGKGDRDLLLVLGTGFILLAIGQTAITALRAWLIMVVGTRLNLELLSNVHQHLLRLPMSWFIKRKLGDVISRFESLNSIQHTLSTSFLEAMIDGLMVIITLVMMFLYSVKLALVAVTAAGLYSLLRWVLYRPARLATERLLIKSAAQQGHFLESMRGMQAIKLRAREEQRCAAWQNLAVDQFNAHIRTQRLDILYQGLNGLLFGLENVVTVWLGALMVLAGPEHSSFTLGMLFAFLAYKMQFVQRVGDLVEKGLELRMLSLHAERVGDIVATPIETGLIAQSAAAQPADNSIEFRSVSFRYAESMPLVIENFSMRVADGESVALVGRSGCGKTTLIKLMLGLLEPCSGMVLIGGVPLKQIGLSQYRGSVASVMQDDQLFAGTIAENICFFDPQPDSEHIAVCTKLAAIYDDIVAMPMQFDTLVGDMGLVLSGGQKQRVLLARALYGKPRILFLDEATSHLDVNCERSVSEAVRSLGLTRLIVAHRPETIRMADRVIELHDVYAASPQETDSASGVLL